MINKIFTVSKSYHDNFKSLSDDDIKGLCTHNLLLEKVHNELKGSEKDVSIFGQNLQMFKESGGVQENIALARKVYEAVSEDSNNNLSFYEAKPAIDEFRKPFRLGVYQKLLQRNANTRDIWTDCRKCLYDGDDLNFFAAKRLVHGISFKHLTMYERFSEGVQLFAEYVINTWTSTDITTILNVCKYSEKFVFLLLYPYFIKPLGKVIWPTLFSHFHFVSGSFKTFIKKVGKYLKTRCKFKIVNVKTAIRFALGFTGGCALALYNDYFFGSAKAMFLSNEKFYKGFGTLEYRISTIRLKGSKIVYEIAKTLSTFSNAALAGAFEPKRETTSEIINSDTVPKVIKSVKK